MKKVTAKVPGIHVMHFSTDLSIFITLQEKLLGLGL
jgi:hypothetical protein